MKSLQDILIQFLGELKTVTQSFGFEIHIDIEQISLDFSTVGLINSINMNSNISLVGQISTSFDFNFDAEQTNEEFLIFGTDHGPCDYGIELKTGKIALLEIITGKFLFYVAKDEMSFIDALSKIIEFENLYLKGIKVDVSITRKIREESINAAGGEQYSKLYRYVIICEEDMPQEPFTLP